MEPSLTRWNQRYSRLLLDSNQEPAESYLRLILLGTNQVPIMKRGPSLDDAAVIQCWTRVGDDIWRYGTGEAAASQVGWGSERRLVLLHFCSCISDLPRVRPTVTATVSSGDYVQSALSL